MATILFSVQILKFIDIDPQELFFIRKKLTYHLIIAKCQNVHHLEKEIEKE